MQNTTDEDSMVVQHILCSRMGKREVKPEPIPEVKPEPVNEITEEGDEIKSEVDDKEAEANSVEKTIEEKTKESEDNDDEKVETSEKEKSDDEEEIEMEKDKDVKEEDESKALEVETPKVETSVIDAKPQMVEIEEYFVKYRNFSYLHCEWRTEEELYKGDKRIQAKLKRFKQKLQQSTNIFENVSLFVLFY